MSVLPTRRSDTLAAIVPGADDFAHTRMSSPAPTPHANDPADTNPRPVRHVADSELPSKESPSKIIAFSALLPWAAAACFAATAAVLAERYLASQSETALLHEQIATVEIALKSVQNENDAAQIIARRQVDTLIQQVAATGRQLDAAQQRAASAESRLAAEAKQPGASAQGRNATLPPDLQSQGDLASLRIATLAPQSENSPPALAVAVWDPAKQEGVLRVEHLPALAADKDYQLWLVDPQYPDPVDGGVFSTDAPTGAARVKFKGRQPVATIVSFAVTLERKGGVPKPEGPVVLVSK